MRFARPLLLAVGRRMPQSVVRAVGRQPGGLFSRIDSLARFTLAGEQVIAHGAGSGLRFNTGGGRVGYALGTWEPQVQDVFASILAPGQVVYDVGAASGFFSVIAARQVGSAGQVVAFEPMPESAARLRHNIALNEFDNVHVLELALGDRAGRAELTPGVDEDQASVNRSAEHDGAAGAIDVEVTTIDRLVETAVVPPPDVIKMDIEGAEIEALRGAQQTLSERQPLLLVESHNRWDELGPLLSAHEYRHRVVEEGGQLASPDPVHVLAVPQPP